MNKLFDSYLIGGTKNPRLADKNWWEHRITEWANKRMKRKKD
jgi:hypothetical protein